jgi:hypothetical protein
VSSRDPGTALTPDSVLYKHACVETEPESPLRLAHHCRLCPVPPAAPSRSPVTASWSCSPLTCAPRRQAFRDAGEPFRCDPLRRSAPSN